MEHVFRWMAEFEIDFLIHVDILMGFSNEHIDSKWF